MLQRQRSPAAPCAPYGGSPCSNFSFMRGCAGLKLSDTFARGVGGATARGWSTSQSRLRVAVPSGLFLCDRHTRGSRLESVFCCGLTVLLFYFPNVSGHRRRLVRRTVERLVRIFFHAGLCQFEMVRGVCAGCWWGDRSRLELFVIATPRCRADRIISRRPRYAREPFGVGVLLFCCVLTGLLFYYSNPSHQGTTHLVRRTLDGVVLCPNSEAKHGN